MSGSKSDSAGSASLPRGDKQVRPGIHPRHAGSLPQVSQAPDIQLALRDRGLLFALMKLFP